MPQDDELILLEEKIYLLPGAKPKANGRPSLPVIGSKTNRDEGNKIYFHGPRMSEKFKIKTHARLK